jgi:protein-tyrosine phosphatase
MFVCSGNTCRSPMAAHILRRRLSEAGLADAVEVVSSGLRARDIGSKADPRAAAALHAAGYTSEHAVRQFELDMFGRYDLIVALDTGHEQLLLQHAPDESPAAEIRLLRSFDPAASGTFDVPDPVRGDISDYEQVRCLIEAAVPGLVAVISQRL